MNDPRMSLKAQRLLEVKARKLEEENKKLKAAVRWFYTEYVSVGRSHPLNDEGDPETYYDHEEVIVSCLEGEG